jgi:hypothetical protein
VCATAAGESVQSDIWTSFIFTHTHTHTHIACAQTRVSKCFSLACACLRMHHCAPHPPPPPGSGASERERGSETPGGPGSWVRAVSGRTASPRTMDRGDTIRAPRCTPTYSTGTTTTTTTTAPTTHASKKINITGLTTWKNTEGHVYQWRAAAGTGSLDWPEVDGVNTLGGALVRLWLCCF